MADQWQHTAQVLDMSSEVRDMAKGILGELCVVWRELGLDHEAVGERFSTFRTHTKSLFDEMIREERDLVVKLRRKIESLMQQLNTINLDLDMSASVDVEGLGALPTKNKLEDCLRSLRTLHSEHLEQRNQLEEQELELCRQLGRHPLDRPERNALAPDTLRQLKAHVANLRVDKDMLMSSFIKTRSEIVSLYAALEDQPATEFEQSVTCPNTQEFSLAPDSMNRVKGLLGDLKERLQNVKVETERLRERLSQLWARLEVDSVEREAFLDNFPGCTRRTREALKEEIVRCEELKHQNIEKFIVRMREELVELWDKCCVSEEERDQFRPFKSERFSDELLETHEAEVRRLESFFSANRTIFEMLARRAELWDRMAMLEAQAQDKTRLFQNRGGQLLKEEKERKQIQKEVPQVERELKNMINQWEESSGEPFMLHGRPAIEVLEEQMENREMGKERVKQERKAAQRKQLEKDAVMGTTMLSGTKRKLASNTPEMSRKHPRITPAKQALPAKVASGMRQGRDMSLRQASQRRMAARGLNGTRLQGAGRTHDKQQPLSINIINVLGGPSVKQNHDDTIASTISYTEFSHHLEARATRSSAVATHAPQHRPAARQAVKQTLKPPTKSSESRCPMSAPAKPPRHLLSTPKTSNINITTKRTPMTAPKSTRTRNILPIIF